jgi:hypothetical protein
MSRRRADSPPPLFLPESRIEKERSERSAELDLGLPDIAEAEHAAHKRGQFTGEHLWTHDKPRYDAVVQALATRQPIRWICTTYRVSAHTVFAIRDREGSEIATRKATLAGRMLDAAELAVERAIDKIDDLPADKAAITASVLTERARELLGEADSMRHTHVHVGMTMDEFAAALRTGSAAEEIPAMRPARAAVVDLDATPFQPGLNGGTVDMESTVEELQPVKNQPVKI